MAQAESVSDVPRTVLRSPKVARLPRLTASSSIHTGEVLHPMHALFKLVVPSTILHRVFATYPSCSGRAHRMMAAEPS